MKQILIFLLICTSTIASACNWTNVNVGYGDSCNRYNFEVSGTVDTCFKIEAKIYLGTTLKATYLKRNFKHYFQDTGIYIVRVKIINTCTNCDTLIYKQIHVTCKPSGSTTGCNWSKAGIYYSQNCNKFTFEMGSFDTCFKYTTLVYRNGHVDTISDDRVFTHTFSDTGTYYIRTTFRNKCTNCDTVIYKQIHITCLLSTSCDWSKVGIYYSQHCNKFTFEMGSFDTCFKYTTLVIRNGHVDTISDDRVFTHTFSDTGTYYIRTTFRNKCTNCDTVIYKEIHITCLLSKGCDWSKVGIYYSQHCNKFTFEMGSFDTCFKYTTLVYRNGHVDTISDDRVFTHTFSDTGTYYIRTTFRNKCTNCDTVIYKQIHITCLLSKGCDWSKVGIYYSQHCNKFTFEMGSFDTCFKYTTLAKKNGHVDTISDDRVFTHTFSDTGTYYIRTTFRNKCTNCDTVMVKEIHITCLTADIQSWNDMAHPVFVYPNPAASSVTLAVENIHQLGEVNLALYSSLGNIIYEQKLYGDTSKIPINHLANGIYFLKLTSDNHVYATKLQIQH